MRKDSGAKADAFIAPVLVGDGPGFGYRVLDMLSRHSYTELYFSPAQPLGLVCSFIDRVSGSLGWP